MKSARNGSTAYGKTVQKKRIQDGFPPTNRPRFSKHVTNLRYFKLCGLYSDSSISNKIIVSIPIVLLITGAAAFIMFNVIYIDDGDDIVIMENTHWIITYVAVILWRIEMARKCDVYVEMSRNIKSGVYVLKNYSERDLNILQSADEYIVKMNRVFTISFIVAVMASMTKSTVFADDPFQPFFYMWFPIEMNSYLRVNVARLYQIGCGWSAASGACAFILTFIAISAHIEARMEILIGEIERLLSNRTPEEMRNKAKDMCEVRERISGCLEHHKAILRLFDKFSHFTSVNLGITAVLNTLMLCTLAYLLTHPHVDIPVVITFSGVVIPELFLIILFRTHGQTITDMSEKINYTIYQLDWWRLDIKTQKDILMWLRLTSKPLGLTSGGFRNVSHAGIKDLLQTTYTYFNMLKAGRGGKKDVSF